MSSVLNTERAIPVDQFGQRLRSVLVKPEEQQVLISNLVDSEQAADIHNTNCGGFGRLWHKSVQPEEQWGEIPLPYVPAAAKLGVSRDEAALIQVFQSAGCNYRCWFCFVDYRLLKGDIGRSRYFTADELVSLYASEPVQARVIRLSGGQPDLTPEWTPWMMRALARAGLDKSTYLWLDDNLSNDFAWTVLRDEDWATMLAYKNFGRVGCLKGYDAESFHFNTKAPSEHFARQLEILGRLVRTGLDVYVYLVLTSSGTYGVADKLERLLDQLQAIHPSLPLRVVPLKIKPYTPTVARANPNEVESMEHHQYVAHEAWRDALGRRFSADDLAQPCTSVEIRP